MRQSPSEERYRYPLSLVSKLSVNANLWGIPEKLIGWGLCQPVQESHNTSNQNHRELSQSNTPSDHFASANANFAFSLYHLIASPDSGKNIFFSPLSISIALAMLSTGAAGDTQTQILEGLGFNLTKLSLAEIHEGFRSVQHILSHPSTKPDIYVGNVLILSQDLKLLPEFVNTTEASYNGKVLRSNFADPEATTQFINNYVKEKTHGKIKNLVSDLRPNINMVLVNYIFFRGLWKKPFPPSKVSESDFYVDEKTVVKVPMMLQNNQEHWYLDDRYVPCTVLRMDYRGDAVAFFILPQKGKMQEVEQVLSPGMLTRWNRLLQKRVFYRKLSLHFPKFSIENSYALDEILSDLGFQDLFTQHANFSNINKEEKLQLSKVFHKTTLDVNEVGTEAAAATGASIMFFSAQHERRVLVFNRPFFMVLFSTSTQNVLFMGKRLNRTICSDFLNAMKMLYMADTFTTNFGNPDMAKKQINDYVAKQTNGKIEDIIKDLDNSHIMVLINYIFFKAKWETAFNDKNTHLRDFHMTPRKTIQVPMMNNEDDYYYIQDQYMSCTVVKIPYQDNIEALFILPNEGKMHQLENSLNKRILHSWLKLVPKRLLNLYLPKFSIEGTYQLEKILPTLGIRNIFTDSANMSGITDHPNIKLSEMIHKSMVEVDESGTTATAATGELFTFRSARPMTIKIEFNRPFLFAIMEDMNLFFLGRVVQPGDGTLPETHRLSQMES
ncbi:kallistatin [Sigmodon hispidus]